MKIFGAIIFFSICGLGGDAFSQTPLPQLFLFLGKDPPLTAYKKIIMNPCVTGVQIIYSWKELEPKKNIYDFSKITHDLIFLQPLHKKLFIQIQDRSFQPNVINVPTYLTIEKKYHGGVAKQVDFAGEGSPISQGWVAKVWEPTVRKRFQTLIKKLAFQFDGKIYGINFPETAVDFDPKKLPQGFTPHRYFYAELQNLEASHNAFHKSIVIQYVNFFPGEWNNDHHFMGQLFTYALENHIGLGGPDVVPYRKGQMKNSYPFFHAYKGKLSVVGMAIQSPDYIYQIPRSCQHYNFKAYYDFATSYLGATILFWNIKEPFFSKELAPSINSQYFQCQ